MKNKFNKKTKKCRSKKCRSKKYRSKKYRKKSGGDNNDNYTELMIAVDADNLESVENLITNGANINKKGRFGSTALMLVCIREESTNSIQIAFALIDNKADLNTRRNDGHTALDLAVINDNIKIATALIMSGGELSVDVDELSESNSDKYMLAMTAANENKNLDVLSNRAKIDWFKNYMHESLQSA
jgi:ankyrin repeat protein